MNKMGNLNIRKIENLVEKTYNKVALCYSEVFSKNPNYLSVLKKLIRKIPKGANVLDAGCGVGVPVTKFLAKKFNVTGIDISRKMLVLARKNVINAIFKKMSLTDIRFRSASFDLICSFFVLFHVKKSEIPKVIKKFYELLKDGGYITIALGGPKIEKERISDFFGEKMYFAEPSRKILKNIIKDAGFKIIYFKFLPYEYARNKVEKELFIIAKKVKNKGQ